MKTDTLRARMTTAAEVMATPAGPALRLLLKQGAKSVPSEWMLIPMAEVPRLIQLLEKAMADGLLDGTPPAGRA